nr:long-chain-fatty-acid--coa ligase 2 [Quercus suber]
MAEPYLTIGPALPTLCIYEDRPSKATTTQLLASEPLQPQMSRNLKSSILEARVVNRGPYTIEVSDCPELVGETKPRRSVKVKGDLHSRPAEEITTTHDLLTYVSKKYGHSRCVGTRELLNTFQDVRKVTIQVDGEDRVVEKTWTSWELGPFRYQSYIEFERQALQHGAGLRKLGLGAGDHVHLYAPTSYAIAHPSPPKLH